ncbi:hypothetical protein Ptr902_13265 [Pyrenophora tritici-repentis]|nr:hypothetical protein Ptr902_13265 [Pyrenophora tritici-repentis]
MGYFERHCRVIRDGYVGFDHLSDRRSNVNSAYCLTNHRALGSLKVDVFKNYGLGCLYLGIRKALSSCILYSCTNEKFVVNTSTTTSYYPTNSFEVLAGTGSFNRSLVLPLIRTVKDAIPYLAITASYSFINDPQFSVSLEPSSCVGHITPCDSYCFPGGIYLMWPQLNNSSLPVDSVVSIKNAPAMRMDFAEGLSSDDNFFLEADCIVYGGNNTVVKFCLAKSNVYQGSLKAGIYVCGNGTRNGECLVASELGSTQNVTTIFSVSSHTASSINSIKNNTILLVFDLVTEDSTPANDIEALRRAVGWLLDYTAANLPAGSSPTFQFANTVSDAYQGIWKTNAYVSLKSILGFIFWEFTANNNGNPAVVNAQRKNMQPDLPAEFHTTASICQPFMSLVINGISFIAYIALQSAALVFCWTVVIWEFVIHRRLPVTTSFPVVDFGAKLHRSPNSDETLFLGVKQEDKDKQIKHNLDRVRLISAKRGR